MDNEGFQAYLHQHDEEIWEAVLENLIPSVHPVDRDATRIWFALWPLKLLRLLQASTDEDATAKEFLLDGKYRLHDHVDSSVDFLYGSIYWHHVKQALIKRSSSESHPPGENLEGEIRSLAQKLASELNTEPALLLGISAVAFMAHQQLGARAFQVTSDSRETKQKKISPERILKQRSRRRTQGLFGFLRTVNRKFKITFDERKASSTFQCIEGQDLSSASAGDERDYQTEDHRRIAGPIPAECRVASCGYCWIGILSGRKNLIEMSDHERKRLEYFGYADASSHHESHPLIRLACQSKCYGDVTVIVPPWNGSLKGRR